MHVKWHLSLGWHKVSFYRKLPGVRRVGGCVFFKKKTLLRRILTNCKMHRDQRSKFKGDEGVEVRVGMAR